MITEIYFTGEAEKYSYECKRLLFSYFLPHDIKIYTDILPDKDGYAQFYAKDSRFCVTVADNGVISKETICNSSDDTERENTLLSLLYDIMADKYGKKLPWGILTGVRPIKYIGSIMEKQGDSAESYILDTLKVSREKYLLSKDVIALQKPYVTATDLRNAGLYVSVPFCPSRCSYCSFVSKSGDSALKLMDKYYELLLKELDIYREMCKRYSLNIETIYIGGGTPTMFSADKLSGLIEKLHSFDLSCLKEFTAEAGRPDTITEEKLTALKNGGVGRISINPQTMNDEVLCAIGRRHTEKDVYNAFDCARKVGFDSINSDLIAGLPLDTVQSFSQSVDKLIALSPENITVHTLSLKRSSALYRDYSDDIGRYSQEMTTAAYNKLSKAGYMPYYLYRQTGISENLENIGYCKPYKESLYNIVMMEDCRTILGAGCASSTKLYDGKNTKRVMNYKYPYEYIDRFQLMNEKKKETESFLSMLFPLEKE